ncbi:MAG: BON domain-containing protein [Chitinophagaceae bacterium]|nr:MAG: BON domain-containing protein [Chitinophagaceae bacterium]
MKKSILQFSAVILLVAGSFTSLESCKSKPKDADIETAIGAKSSTYPGLSATVKDGVATLSGTASDEATKVAFENDVKAVEGVKSVVNNISVAPPVQATAPVEIAADDPIAKGLADATKEYPTVTATVNDGVVTLTGELERSKLPNLMKSINSLKPKKVEQKLTLK